jgi:hypothetical protein
MALLYKADPVRGTGRKALIAAKQPASRFASGRKPNY